MFKTPLPLPSMIDSNYKVIRTLSKSSTDASITLLTKDTATNSSYTIKVSSKKPNGFVLNDYNIGKKLDHQNIVKYVNCIECGSLKQPIGIATSNNRLNIITNNECDNNNESTKVINRYQNSTISYMTSEYCKNGDLLEYIKYATFSKLAARYYFKKLIGAVKYLHQNNIAHRNLNCSNLYFDAEFDLKLGNLIYAVESDNNSFFIDNYGTKGVLNIFI